MNFLEKIFQSLKYPKKADIKNLKPKTYPPERLNVCRSVGRGNLKPSPGFTIVELIVVVAIIGIVSGIIVASVSESKAKGRDAKRIADISVIQLALENYYDKYSKYPTPPLSSDQNFTAEGPVPLDPKTGNDYFYYALNADNETVCSSGSCQSYHLGARLELANGILDDDTVDKDSEAGFSGANLVYDVLPKF